MNVLFWFTHASLNYSFRIFFRNIFVFGAHAIPRNKPILIASNHSNSFLDGMLLHKNLARTLFIFVRGDVFNHPIANKFLRQFRLFPIYRVRDAGNNARLANKKNQASMDEAYGYFKKNQGVVIFSEATASMAKTLLPIRKGTASIALEMVGRSEGSLDLYIVPTGVNYTFFGGLRKDVMIQYGNPIRVLDHYEAWKADAQKAIHELTTLLEKRMREEIICVDHPELAAEAELLLEVARNEVPGPLFFQRRKSPERFHAEKGASEFANEIFKAGNEHLAGAKAAAAYIDLMRDHGLEDIGLSRGRLLGIKWFLLFILFIPALFGVVANGVSWYLAYRLANRLTKDPVFYDSMHVGLNWLISLMFSVGFFIMVYWVAGLVWAVALLSTVLVSAYLAVWWFDIARELVSRIKVWQLGMQDASLLQRIRQARKHLLAEMDQF